MPNAMSSGTPLNHKSHSRCQMPYQWVLVPIDMTQLKTIIKFCYNGRNGSSSASTKRRNRGKFHLTSKSCFVMFSLTSKSPGLSTMRRKLSTFFNSYSLSSILLMVALASSKARIKLYGLCFSTSKGVGCLRQQDGGHGSWNRLRSV